MEEPQVQLQEQPVVLVVLPLLLEQEEQFLQMAEAAGEVLQ
jgi:hypothetical protein